MIEHVSFIPLSVTKSEILAKLSSAGSCLFLLLNSIKIVDANTQNLNEAIIVILASTILLGKFSFTDWYGK